VQPILVTAKGLQWGPATPVAVNDKKVAKIDPKLDAKIDPKVDPNGKLILQQNTALTFTDFPDPTQKISSKSKNPIVHRVKYFPVQMQAGKKYTISLNTQAFNSQMRLETIAGQVVAQDAGLGGGLNSRITFTATQTGAFRIACICRDGKLGAFQLTVLEQ
jgi:hypothetical protein